MEPKTVEVDGKTYVEMKDSKPLFIADDGSEVAVDVPVAFEKIKQLAGEAKGHRTAKEELEAKLKNFDGIDAAAAREALKKLKNLDDKKLMESGEVERVKEEVIKATEEKYAPKIQRLTELEQKMVDLQVGGAFARSKFIADKISLPADLVQARFEKNFKIENDELVPYDMKGNKIYSRENPGEVAGFDEAMEIIVNQYPYKADILRGTGSNGSGTRPAGEGAGSGTKMINRRDFEALDHSERRQKLADGFRVSD